MDTRLDLLPPFTVALPTIRRVLRPAHWRLAATDGRGVEVHVVLQGVSRLDDGSPTSRRLAPGDVIVLRGLTAITDSAAQGGGAETLVAQYPASAFLAPHRLPRLPAITHLATTAPAPGRSERLVKVASLLRDAAAEQSRATGLFVQHLFDALFVAVLESASGDGLSLAPSPDERISKAVALMHEQVAEPWTTAGLARVVGMSRAAFALRFAALMGAPPLTYLARVRMARAATLLVHGHDTTDAVALAVGYRSVFAFSRAFKRLTGVPPTVYRQRERQRCGPIVASANGSVHALRRAA